MKVEERERDCGIKWDKTRREILIKGKDRKKEARKREEKYEKVEGEKDAGKQEGERRWIYENGGDSNEQRREILWKENKVM